MEPTEQSAAATAELPPCGAGEEREEASLPPALRQRGQRSLIRAAMTASVIATTILGTTVPTLYLLGLGARELTIGVLVMLMSISPLGQLVGLRLVPRLGKAGVLLYGRLVQLPLAAGLIVLAGVGVSGDWVVLLAMGLFSLLAFVSSVSYTTWWPLVQDNVPGATLGTFFARMRTRLRAVEVGVPLLVGFYLASRPPLHRFALPFALGWVALAVGAWYARQIPELPAAAVERGLWGRMAQARRSPAVRRYIAYTSIYNFVIALFTAFWVVLLTAKPGNVFVGLPAGHVMWLAAVAAVGHVLGLKFWARLVDLHGGRPALGISHIGAAALGLAWLALPSSHWLLTAWAAAFFLAWGFLDGGMLMARTCSLVRCVDRAHQSESFTLVALCASACGALGGLLGGLAFDWLSRRAAQHRPLGLDPRAIYLCVVQLGLLGAWLASRHLVGHDRQTPTRHLLGSLWRRIAGSFAGPPQTPEPRAPK